jgi:hypothetical protein
MSFASKLKSTFTSFGHAIAAGSKYFVVGVAEVVKVAAKAEVLHPEVDALASILGGPTAVKAADLSFYALGQVAQALKPLSDDQAAAVAASGLNIQLDLATINDIKALITTIETMLAARGTPAPKP